MLSERQRGVLGIMGLALLPVAVLALAAALTACAQDASAAETGTETVYDKPAEVSRPRTDGPIYNLPYGVGQCIVCDRQNREYLLLTTSRGGVFLMPYLDEDGEQAVMPRS